MELKELITSIKQFEKQIISYKDYCDIFNEHYLFHSQTNEFIQIEDEKNKNLEWGIINNLLSKLNNYFSANYPNINIYDLLMDYEPKYIERYHIVWNKSEKNNHWLSLESFAIIKMYEQIEKLLDSIDIELTMLEMENPSKYSYICKELLPKLLNTIQSKYLGYKDKSPHQICSHIFKNSTSLNSKTDVLNIEEMASTEIDYHRTQKKERIKLLYQLGIFKYLKDTYPKCKSNESEIARIICKISPDLKKETIQSYINSIMISGLDKTIDKDLEIIEYVNTLKN